MSKARWHKALTTSGEVIEESSAVDLVPRGAGKLKGDRRRLKKGSINQRVGFRFGSGWIHHSSHFEELWTLRYRIRRPIRESLMNAVFVLCRRFMTPEA
jgi:hypothetical protein